MKLGAEPKKVAALVGLLVVALVVYIVNSGDPGGDPSSSGKSGPPPPLIRRDTATVPGAPVQPSRSATPASRPRGNARVLQEFRPTLKPKRPEDRPDPMTVDPTLRTDLLAKLQAVKVEGVHRSIFEFGKAPPPPEAAKPKGPPLASATVFGPQPAPPPAPPVKPPPPPPPPPIPLKFYGYLSANAQPAAKRAFFLEGEDIHVVTEGQVVKRRYKIIRIGINSVVVEDLDNKNQQTLPLEEAPQGT